jgi:hypothetical protein
MRVAITTLATPRSLRMFFGCQCLENAAGLVQFRNPGHVGAEQVPCPRHDGRQQIGQIQPFGQVLRRLHHRHHSLLALLQQFQAVVHRHCHAHGFNHAGLVRAASRQGLGPGKLLREIVCRRPLVQQVYQRAGDQLLGFHGVGASPDGAVI